MMPFLSSLFVRFLGSIQLEEHVVPRAVSDVELKIEMFALNLLDRVSELTAQSAVYNLRTLEPAYWASVSP